MRCEAAVSRVEELSELMRAELTGEGG